MLYIVYNSQRRDIERNSGFYNPIQDRLTNLSAHIIKREQQNVGKNVIMFG